MKKLTSLADLQALLPEDHATHTATIQTKTGYSGKPQRLTVKTERRANKTVTTVIGFEARPGELEPLLKTLKQRCGAGGRTLDNAIELQGDHRTKTTQFLKEQGYTLVS
jgi:predicted translation initiation factor SUI1